MKPRCLFLILSFSLLACGDDGGGGSDQPDAEVEPSFDREIDLPGMDGPASIYIDGDGVLHAQCASDADCLAVQGYMHASTRFFQMDLRRRLARGKLTEIAGPIVLDTDLRSRTVLATRDGNSIAQQLLDSADEDTRAAMEAYARGVNAWIDDLRNERNGAKLSAEYDFSIIDKTRIDAWEVLDTAACFLPLMDQLTNSSAADLRAGEALALLGNEVGNDLFGLRTPSTSATLSPTTTGASAAQAPRSTHLGSHLGVMKKALATSGEPKSPEVRGSNNWVVAPSKGQGKALLANDPHLTLSNPSIWYYNHLDAKSAGDGELHIAGASFPGMPGILFGQNGDIAWGVTTTFFDQADVYLETLNAEGDAVIFNGEEVPIVEVEHSFEVPDGAPQTRTAQYVPHHGPILSIDTDAGTATTLRWAAQDADTDLNFLWGMWTATNLEDARDALLNVTSPGQNFVVIDRLGSIGWYPFNRVPERPWLADSPSWLPLPGDGTREWAAYLDYSELPQATNPSSGFIATANNDMTGALLDGDQSNEGQKAAQSHVADGYRHQRIAELLDASDDHDVASMQEIQADTHSLYGELIAPTLVTDAATAGGLSPLAAQAVTMLNDWDYSCPTGFDSTVLDSPIKSEDASIVAASQGCAIFHVVWSRLRELTFQDELDEADADFFIRHQPMAIALLRPSDLSQEYWDNVTTKGVETREDIIAEAFEEAVIELESELGSDVDDWRWGSLHTLTLRADLFDAAGVTDFNSSTFMNDGALSTVDVASPRNDLNDDYSHSAGASTRLSCSADSSEVSCFYDLPGGQVHHRDDDFYLSLLPDWLRNQPKALLFSIDDAKGAASESIQIK